MAAAVRGHFAYLQAGEMSPLRLHPLRAVLCEVFGRERRRRVLRDNAGVELLDRLERVRELRLLERPFRQENACGLLVSREQLRGSLRHAFEARGPRTPLARGPARRR